MTAAGSVVGTASAFWAYMQRKDKVRVATTRLLMGLAYDKLMTLGVKFIERGTITRDEYEDYRKYLYEPYKALGGNGVAERIMSEVSNLPIRSNSKFAEMFGSNRDNEEFVSNVRIVPRSE